MEPLGLLAVLNQISPVAYGSNLNIIVTPSQTFSAWSITGLFPRTVIFKAANIKVATLEEALLVQLCTYSQVVILYEVAEKDVLVSQLL